MARTVKDVRLESRAARERLEPRKKPYYRAIEQGRHLGYYKGPRGGVWFARAGERGKYQERKLGVADDVRDANGGDVLSFAQAQGAARDWFDRRARGDASDFDSLTVAQAVEQYIEERDARTTSQQGRAVKSSAAHKLRLHVSGKHIADLLVSRLRAADLKEWRKSLPGSASSRQRITNDFKAALNRATSDVALRQIFKEGLAPGREQGLGISTGDSYVHSKILRDDDVRALLSALKAAGDEDVYRLCLLLAATGARFAQARRLRVKDVQFDLERVAMPPSNKGKSSDAKADSINIPLGSDVLNELRAITMSRKPNEPLFERWRHVQTGPREWKRDRRGPWLSAAELARPIRAAAVAAELPPSTSSYSFRHSSIVRALREGLPVPLVAQMHDTGILMIERNYARYITDALQGLARKAIVPIVVEPKPDNVVALRE